MAHVRQRGCSDGLGGATTNNCHLPSAGLPAAATATKAPLAVAPTSSLRLGRTSPLEATTLRLEKQISPLEALIDGRALLSKLAASKARREAQSCPEGHSLKSFAAPCGGWTCSVCEKVVDIGTELRSCRECDFDICPQCASQRASQADPQTKLASGPLSSAQQCQWCQKPMGWILGRKGFGWRQRHHVDRCAARHNRHMSLNIELGVARARCGTSEAATTTPSSRKTCSPASSARTQSCNGEAVADYEEHPEIKFTGMRSSIIKDCSQEEMVKLFENTIRERGRRMYKEKPCIAREALIGEQAYMKVGMGRTADVVVGEPGMIIRTSALDSEAYFVPSEEFEANWVLQDATSQLFGWKEYQPSATILYQVNRDDVRSLPSEYFRTSFGQLQCVKVGDALTISDCFGVCTEVCLVSKAMFEQYRPTAIPEHGALGLRVLKSLNICLS